MCLGNHDYMGRPEAQIERTDHDASGRWQMPSRAYSRLFVEGSVAVEIFSIDTNAISYTLTPETAGACAFAVPLPGCSPRFEKEGPRVVDELRRLLDASTATWKIVAGHHPLFSGGHHGSASETAPLRAALLPLFDRYGVDLYACGHDHIAQHVVPKHNRNTTSTSSASSARPDGATVLTEGRGEGERGGANVHGPQAVAEVVTVRTTDHVSIGTSGPMVMPGEYDFRFEWDDVDGYENVTISNGNRGREEKEEKEGEEGVASPGSHLVDGAGGDYHEDGDLSASGFDLWFATKRRAFGVVEASEEVLRLTLVGKDGNVLYSYDRRR
ncbi:unnamed protein product [Scytosiphon promiscuus]